MHLRRRRHEQPDQQEQVDDPSSVAWSILDHTRHSFPLALASLDDLPVQQGEGQDDEENDPTDRCPIAKVVGGKGLPVLVLLIWTPGVQKFCLEAFVHIGDDL